MNSQSGHLNNLNASFENSNNSENELNLLKNNNYYNKNDNLNNNLNNNSNNNINNNLINNLNLNSKN